MDKMIDLVFSHADRAHIQHLASESYAEHMALGEFYDAARTAVDAIVEASIGLDMPPPAKVRPPILQQLEEGYVDLVEMRDEVCAGASVLENLFDNLTAAYATAIYKLKRFKK